MSTINMYQFEKLTNGKFTCSKCNEYTEIDLSGDFIPTIKIKGKKRPICFSCLYGY